MSTLAWAHCCAAGVSQEVEWLGDRACASGGQPPKAMPKSPWPRLHCSGLLSTSLYITSLTSQPSSLPQNSISVWFFYSLLNILRICVFEKERHTEKEAEFTQAAPLPRHLQHCNWDIPETSVKWMSSIPRPSDFQRNGGSHSKGSMTLNHSKYNSALSCDESLRQDDKRSPPDPAELTGRWMSRQLVNPADRQCRPLSGRALSYEALRSSWWTKWSFEDVLVWVLSCFCFFLVFLELKIFFFKFSYLIIWWYSSMGSGISLLKATNQ